MHTTWVLLIAIGAALAALPCEQNGNALLNACSAFCNGKEQIPALLYNCTDAGAQDKALFIWANGTFTSAPINPEKFTFDLKFVNASGSNTIFSGDLISPFAYNRSVIGREVDLTLDYNPATAKQIDYTFTAIYCTPTGLSNTGMELTWADPAGVSAGLLNYTVYDLTTSAPAQGSAGTGNQFNLAVQCDKNLRTFEVRSALPSPALTCLTPSTTVQVAVNTPISAITNLQLVTSTATTNATYAELLLNATWTAPAQVSGCTSVTYYARVTGGAGVDVSAPLNTTVSGSDVTLAALVPITNPNFGNGMFTLEIYASTAAGDSPKVNITFTVDPCATSCPTNSPCSFSCVCNTPPNVTVVLNRNWQCNEPAFKAGFFGVEIASLTSGTVELTSTFWNVTGPQVTAENATGPKVFPVGSGLLNGSAVGLKYQPTLIDANSSFWAQSATFGCVVSLESKGGLSFGWNAPQYSTDLMYTVYRNGEAVTAPSANLFNYTATADCNAPAGLVNFTVQTMVGWGVNLSCSEQSAPLQLQLNPMPESPTNVVVTDKQGAMNETQSILFFNVTWAAPAAGSCPVTYTAVVSTKSGNYSVPLVTVTDNVTVFVPSGVVVENFIFANKQEFNVSIVATSASGSASSVSSSFSAPDPCSSTCPVTVDPATTGCNVVCKCGSPAALRGSLVRTYACGDITGPAGFFWTTATLVNGEATLLANYNSSIGSTVVYDGVFNETIFLKPVATNFTATAVSINFSTLEAPAAHSLSFETHAIGCVTTLKATEGSLVLSWAKPAFAADWLSYTVWQDGKPIETVTETQYTAVGKCNAVGSFQLQSTLIPTNTTCPLASDVINVTLSFAPQPITGLRVLSTNASATTIVVNPTWNAPASLGYCPLDFYKVVITSDHGLSKTVELNGTDIVNTNGTVTVPAGVVLSGVDVQVNAVYTISVSVVTAKGESVAESEQFYLPGFLCMDTCALVQGCAVKCSCKFPQGTNASSLNRTFNCDLQKEAGFFFTTLVENFETSVGTVSVGYTNATGATVPLVTGSQVVAFNVSSFITMSIAQLSVKPADPQTENKTFTYNANTIPCVANVTSLPAELKLTWTIAEAAAPFLNFSVLDSGAPASGAFGDDKLSFTLTPKCNGFANLTVLSMLAQYALPCVQSSAFVPMVLSFPPSAVTDLAVVGQSLVANSTESTLGFNASWTAPAQLWGCDVVTYHMVINSSTTTIFSEQVVATVVNNTVSLVQSLVLVNVTLDANAIYTVAVTAITAAGTSDPSSVTFSFPSGSSSSSGLSNTVIAGIAVGATIGVVAIALVVYKCMSSRKDYEPLSGSSNV